MLKWDYDTMVAGDGGPDGTGCFTCHTEKDNPYNLQSLESKAGPATTSRSLNVLKTDPENSESP